MYLETKEEILEKILAHEKPKCKYCGDEMKIWETPPIPVGDGLGWGAPYLFICFNDECSYFIGGWKWMWEKFRHKVSYRHRHDPETGEQGPLPVWSAAALKDGIIEQN